MKKLIKVKNTYNLKVKGKPSNQSEVLPSSEQIIISPKRIDKLKVKLLIKEGDTVQIGSPLYTDKKQPHVVFLSPASGVVEKIELGDRRSIEKIIIKRSENEESVQLFEPFNEKSIDSLSKENAVDCLTQGGVWMLFKQYPFNTIPSPDELPPSIYVSIDYDEPHMPDSSVFLKEYENEFLTGLSILKKLSDQVHVGVSENNYASLSESVKSATTHKLRGCYPANDPAVFLFYNKKTEKENKSWGIRSLDVIRIGQLFLSGQYPTDRLIVIAGALCKEPRYLRTREGVSLKFIKNELVKNEPYRIIGGGVLSGTTLSIEDGLGYQDYAIHLIRDGQEQEILSFFRPGFDKPTFSNTYLSATVDRDDWEFTTSLNGGYRACISCGYCKKVCPVETAPQLIMKALKDNDYETAVEYGLLDTVSSGLYTYVCPSKIELDTLFTDAKNKLYRDLTA